jgi:hypothetical protein
MSETGDSQIGGVQNRLSEPVAQQVTCAKPKIECGDLLQVDNMMLRTSFGEINNSAA